MRGWLIGWSVSRQIPVAQFEKGLIYIQGTDGYLGFESPVRVQTCLGTVLARSVVPEKDVACA